MAKVTKNISPVAVELPNLDLGNTWSIVEMIRVDISLGDNKNEPPTPVIFPDRNTWSAYKSNHPELAACKTDSCHILTDGITAFLVNPTPMQMFSQEDELALERTILTRVTLEECRFVTRKRQ